MKYGEVGHTAADPFLIFADYVYEKMKTLPAQQWRQAFKSLTVNTQHDINEVRAHVMKKLKRDGLL